MDKKFETLAAQAEFPTVIWGDPKRGDFVLFQLGVVVPIPEEVKADVITRGLGFLGIVGIRSEEHTSELQSHSNISYAVFCLKKKKSSM